MTARHDGEEARTALLRAQTERHEVVIAKARRELITVDAAYSTVMQISSMMATSLESLPARVVSAIASALPDGVNQGDLIHAALAECRSIRAELARIVEQSERDIGNAEAGGIDTDTAAAEDG
jgi:hypothetical protein